MTREIIHDRLAALRACMQEENLDAEEQLAADIMRQNGGTVDYMA